MIFQVNPAMQRIHVKNQALFSSKDKIKMSSAAFFVWRFKDLNSQISKSMAMTFRSPNREGRGLILRK